MATRLDGSILIIDDDRLFCDTVGEFLRGRGLRVAAEQTGSGGLERCAETLFDVVLLDQNLPDGEGHRLCPAILEQHERTKIIFITAHPSFESAVQAIRGGAYDYLSKPFALEELLLAVENALTTAGLERVAQVEDFKSRRTKEQTVIVGVSAALGEVIRLAELAAGATAPVLITGETGTGKGLVARTIHFRSRARKGAFIDINCAALPENLIEAELFGYERGAFTGAASGRQGLFEMADRGTLFLDEIGEMPAHLQSKLLSALEDGRIRRLGSGISRPVDVRLLAATAAALSGGHQPSFRSDLYYRLSVIQIHIPPLRERREDIPPLCEHFLKGLAAGRELTLPEAEVARLSAYDWPGNVRELRNVLERAVIVQAGPRLAPSALLAQQAGPLPAGSRAPASPGMGSPGPSFPAPALPGISLPSATRPVHAAPGVAPPPFASSGSLLPGGVPSGLTSPAPAGESFATLEEMEEEHIRRALDACSGNISRSAAALGISLSTLKRKIKILGLKRPGGLR